MIYCWDRRMRLGSLLSVQQLLCQGLQDALGHWFSFHTKCSDSMSTCACIVNKLINWHGNLELVLCGFEFFWDNIAYCIPDAWVSLNSFRWFWNSGGGDLLILKEVCTYRCAVCTVVYLVLFSFTKELFFWLGVLIAETENGIDFPLQLYLSGR